MTRSCGCDPFENPYEQRLRQHAGQKPIYQVEMEEQMIMILKREDLPREVRGKPADELDLFDTGLESVQTNSAELIVFMENEEIRVLKANRWSKGREMPVEALIEYVAWYGVRSSPRGDLEELLSRKLGKT